MVVLAVENYDQAILSKARANRSVSYARLPRNRSLFDLYSYTKKLLLEGMVASTKTIGNQC
jgi:hypothetical protein